METRALGRLGQVSAIGYGGWQLGGGWWPGTDAREAERSLCLALERGCSLVDTALVYNDGESERMVGRVVRDLRARDTCVVVTKVPPANKRWPGAAAAPVHQTFAPDHVQRSVEASLKNLKLEALPLCLLHVWHDAWLEHEGWPALEGALARLTQEGKVLHWGVSVNDHAPETALACLELDLIAAIEVIYNIFDPTPAAELLPRAAKRKVGVIARCPFDEGGLTGTITHETEFAKGDFRALYFKDERKVEVEARVAKLRPLVGDEAKTLAELALRFSLAHPAVGSVIPGMRRPSHVTANLAVADGKRLSPALLAELAEHAWAKNFYP